MAFEHQGVFSAGEVPPARVAPAGRRRWPRVRAASSQLRFILRHLSSARASLRALPSAHTPPGGEVHASNHTENVGK